MGIVLVSAGIGAGMFVLAQRQAAPATADTPARIARVEAQVRFASVTLPELPKVPEMFGPFASASLQPGESRSEGAALPGIQAKGPITRLRQGFAGQAPALSPLGGGDKKIVIIIDDMGMDVVHSRAIIALPGPLTLSFLPYAPRVAAMAAEARARGHELMIHMPMQPINPVLDMGSIALKEGMSDADFDTMLGRAFASFDGYVGMNNHMGSRLTQDRAAMARLMAALKARNLLFVDSRTIASSVAAQEAERAGVAYTSRDVFLDDDETVDGVRRSLAKVEDIARRTGVAVAIGHPYAATVEALRTWLPAVKAKGFAIVPVSAVVRR